MKGKRTAGLLLTALALLLGGCGEKQETQSVPTPEPAQETPVRQAEGPAAEAVSALMAPFEKELALIAGQGAAFTIPGDILRQMALDAQEMNAKAENGRYLFTRRQSGDYSYETTAEEAMNALTAENPDETPDPADETPMDSQLNGDYAVSGGGLFERSRAYDMAEDLSSGTAEITDSLNGGVTGHELFSFALRDGMLYFADAALDMAAHLDSLEIREGYLAAAGVLREDGADVIEYRIDDLSQLPDPAAMDWDQLASSAAVISRFSARGETVSVSP